MIRTADPIDALVSEFERRGPDGPGWLRQLRQAAIDRFVELGLPTTRQEEWRFTDVAPLRETTFRQALELESAGKAGDVDELRRRGWLIEGCHRLVFVDGHFAAELSDLEKVPAHVTLGSLAEAVETRPEAIEPLLGRHLDFTNHPFTALNMAFVGDGALVQLPPETTLDMPVHILHVSTGDGQITAAHPHHLIAVDRHAALTVVESYHGLGSETYFTNPVTEIGVGAGARVDHYKLQREAPQAFHFAAINVHQQRDSRAASRYVSTGGRLVRNEINVRLAEPGCECVLDGLYMARGDQHTDCRTRIDHAAPHCDSHELYKGVLADKAEGVFNGKIYVHVDAQKTDAKQSNQALLLSDDAVLNTKPQLEIYADDVKCTHGATVGQLDDEALFYLRSRGIAEADARNLLIYAFANDVVGRIGLPAIRTQLQHDLLVDRGLPVEEELEAAS